MSNPHPPSGPGSPRDVPPPAGSFPLDPDTLPKAIRDELNLTTNQIDLIRQWAATDTDALFSNLTANQRRFLKIQHQLVRMLAKRELKEIGEQ
jgi:hypothetical protein